MAEEKNVSLSAEVDGYDVMKAEDILNIMAKDGVAAGFIPETNIYSLPELNVITRQIIITVHNELIGYFSKEKEDNNPLIFGAWCIYAGMGMTAIWRKDYENFSTGKYKELLVDPRGIAEMDEFVKDYCRLDPDTADRVTINIANSGTSAFMAEMIKKSAEEQLAQMVEYEIACYSFGVSYMLTELELV